MISSYCSKTPKLYAAMQKVHPNVKSTDCNYKLIQGVADSFDYPISPNDLKQTKSMPIIMKQEHSSTEKRMNNPNHIQCMTKEVLLTSILITLNS